MNGEPSHEPASVSVLDPLARAIEWTGDVLFRPFSFEKWIVLGFCAWLSMCGEGGGGGGNGGGGTRWELPSRPDLERSFHEAWEWVLAHLIPILFVASLIVVVVVALWLLVLWLSSRGKFMFLDGVVHNRGAVIEPWRRFREVANSLFVFRILLGLACSAAVLAVLACAACLLWFRRDLDLPDPLLIAGLVLAGLLLFGLIVTFALIGLAIDDFLVPLMYLRRCRVGAAWRELAGLVSARPGTFVLYVIVRIGIAVALIAITLLACCLTCCLVLLPYVGTVILLPLWVFRRSYSVYFLGQFGPPYARFAALGPEPAPA